MFSFDLESLAGFWRDVDAVLRLEFTLMVRLGFFRLADNCYWLSVPQGIDMAQLKQTALDVEVICPESLLATVSLSDAESQRARIIAIEEFEGFHCPAPGNPISLER